MGTSARVRLIQTFVVLLSRSKQAALMEKLGLWPVGVFR